MSFQQAFDKTIGVEGDFSNQKDDTGGETRYGVTKKVARAHGYKGDMKDLPLGTARQIAKSQYWDTLLLDDVCALSPLVADELFDTGYNMGTGTAGKFLQRGLNALNRKSTDYGDITVDGAVGPMTVAALREFLKRRGETGEQVMLKVLNIQQGYRYLEIAEGNKSQETFFFGWIANRVGV